MSSSDSQSAGSEATTEILAHMREVNAALLTLLRGLDDTDWTKPTVHRDRDVKDLTAHLLQGSIRRVSAIRDAYRPTSSPARSFNELVASIQRDNREFITAMKRVSPGVLVELIAHYDPIVVDLFSTMDPDAPGLGVAWAGETRSPNGFDIAREYTEKWHHQQQLRDATGRPALYEPRLFAPVLGTFARGLPHAYAAYVRDDGSSVAIRLSGVLEMAWTLRRRDGAWSIERGAAPAADTTLALSADLAWRLWTKGVVRDDARRSIRVEGDAAALEPLLRFVAIMA